jgi:hypothetical protein
VACQRKWYPCKLFVCWSVSYFWFRSQKVNLSDSIVANMFSMFPPQKALDPFKPSFVCSLNRDTDASSGNRFAVGGLQSWGTQNISCSLACLRGSYLHSWETTLRRSRFTFWAFVTREALSKTRKACEEMHTHIVLLTVWSDQMKGGIMRAWNSGRIGCAKEQSPLLNKYYVSKLGAIPLPPRQRSVKG